jgi:carbamoyltransferase
LLILGLNMFHSDASAALIDDGKIVFAVAEERLNRIKHHGGFPALSVQACLDRAGIGMADIDHVAIGRDPNVHLARKLRYGARNPKMLANLTRMRLKGKSRFENFSALIAHHLETDPGKFRFSEHNVEHHVAHIASAYYCSPWDRAAGFSYDGSGDWVTVMFARCEGLSIEVLDRVFVPHSLGAFYSMVSDFIGYSSYGDEGKVMGLAALGDDALYSKVAKIARREGRQVKLDLSYFAPTGSNQGIVIDDEGRVHQPRLFGPRMAKLFGAPREPRSEITQRDMDLAFALQKRFEEIVFGLLRELHAMTGGRDLAMAGGCALNSVANGKLFDATPFERTYIQPAAGDEGLSVGAALHCYHATLGRPRTEELSNAYLGPGFSDDAIAKALAAAGLAAPRSERGALIERVSGLLAAGKVVGWFQGRTEWGPRALGNRSILAHPGWEGMKDILNARIKHREWFRPFAPAILAERVTDYFEHDHPSPFMLHAYTIKPDKRAALSAVNHVDNTGRLQTVTRPDNELYYDLIKAFGDKTGTPVLLNTSFNENEPIVCTPAEAIDCFVRTRMDVLAIGPYVIEKGDAEA